MKEEKRIVKKSHGLITARMNMTAREQDLATLVMLSVKQSYDSKKVVDGEFDKDVEVEVDKLQKTFSFNIEYIAELFGVSVRTLTNPVSKKVMNETGADQGYELRPSILEHTCNLLRKREVSIRDASGAFVGHNLIPSASFDGYTLRLGITEDVAKLLLNYGPNGKGFGLIDAKLFFKLSSPLAKKILDIISRFKNTDEYKCSIEELCLMLGVNFTDYKDFTNFRKSAIESPLKLIIRDSDGVWATKDGFPRGYEITKKKRRNGYALEDKITFKMKYNEPVEKETLEANNQLDDSMSVNDMMKVMMDYMANGAPEITKDDIELFELQVSRKREEDGSDVAFGLELVLNSAKSRFDKK